MSSVAPTPSRSKDRRHRVHPRGDIGNRNAGLRVRVFGPGDRQQPGLALDEQVVRLFRRVRSRRAVAGDSAPDQPRVARPQLRGAQAEPVRGARREVLHEHVGALEQTREDRPRLPVLHVERQAFLGAIDPDEMRGQALDRMVVVARRVAAVGPLDLDHARAELGELARAERPGDDLLECDDRDSVERPLHANVTVRPGSGTPRSAVVHVSPACTGCASVSTPVVTISPGRSSGANGCLASTPTK